MGLCGSYRCGCGVTSTPAVDGAINGELPSIVVAGSGEPGDPFSLSMNDGWAAEVAAAVAAVALVNVGAWTTWTPVVTQSVGVAVTVTHARYVRLGRLILFTYRLVATGTGTAANIVTISSPVTASLTEAVTGVGHLYDASTTSLYPFILGLNSATTMTMTLMKENATSWTIGNSASFSAAVTTNDVINAVGLFEAAT